MEKTKSSLFSTYLIFIVILMLNFGTLFGANDLNSFDYIKLNISNKVSFDVNLEPNFNLNKLYLTSYFFPQTYNGSQYLNEFTSTKTGFKVTNNGYSYNVLFSYDNSNIKPKNLISNYFILESTVFMPEVKKKVIFPNNNYNKSISKYLEPIGLIDIDTNLANHAKFLAKGENDTFIIASKVAKWIRSEITYDLSSIRELPNQKSTQVLKSKRGVCKEVSNLFISMMRSLGIPARVVTGYSYTNSEELVGYLGSNWGGHAWTEVLIGDTWVPFDLTYDQYGFIDSTHLVLDKNIQINENSVSINGTGYNYNLVQNSLKVNNSFEILDKKVYKKPFNYIINLEGDGELGFNSYGSFQVKIENRDDFYKVLFIQIAGVKEVELLEEKRQMLIFKPNEKKSLNFNYKILDGLNTDMKYTLPFSIYNEFFEENFNVSVFRGGVLKTYDDLEFDKEIRKVGQEKLNIPESLKNLYIYKDFKAPELNCSFFLDKTTNKLECETFNKNSKEIKYLSICLDTTLNCNIINIAGNSKTKLAFQTPKEEVKLYYTFNSKLFEKSFRVNKPSVFFEKEISGDILKVNYTISNLTNETIFNIFQDEVLLKQISNEKGNLEIPIRLINSSLIFELKLRNIEISKEKFNIKVNSIDSNLNKEGLQKIFDNILEFFRKLFTK